MKTIAKLEELARTQARLLEQYVTRYPAFRSKPVGGEGSPARKEQEELVKLEDAAKVAMMAVSVVDFRAKIPDVPADKLQGLENAAWAVCKADNYACSPEEQEQFFKRFRPFYLDMAWAAISNAPVPATLRTKKKGKATV